jgi:hypothetical protein
MFSFHILVTTVSAALLVTAPTFGQAPARVRGTITAIDDNGLAVKERDGRTGFFRARAREFGAGGP